VPCELNAGVVNNWAKAHIHKNWARFLLNPPPCSVAAVVVNSKPHNGARPLGPFVRRARAFSLSRPNKGRACKSRLMSRSRLGTYRFELWGSLLRRLPS
jgi:hypothetical protein